MTLRDEFLGAIVGDKLIAQGNFPQPEWYAPEGTIDPESVPDHLRGPVQMMTRNAQPLADQLIRLVRLRLS